REALHRMPIEYAEIILAVVALFAGILYLRVRRTRSKGKKNKNAVRPASPSRTGIATQAAPEQPAVQTWAPPVTAPRPGSVASTVVQAPPQPQPAASPSWDQPAPAPAPSWDVPAAPPAASAPAASWEAPAAPAPSTAWPAEPQPESSSPWDSPKSD